MSIHYFFFVVCFSASITACEQKSLLPTPGVNKDSVHEIQNAPKGDSIYYHGNFSEFLDTICQYSYWKNSVRYLSYEVTINLDSFGKKGLRVFEDNRLGGKKQKLKLERIYNPSDKDNYNACASFFKKGTTFIGFPVYCTQEYLAKKDAFFTYGKEQYFYLQSIVSERCLGSGCRFHDYPLFYINKNFVDMYVIHQEDDIAEFRLLDLNRDKHLDFLEVTHRYNNSERTLFDTNPKEGMNNYKIRVVSYLNGHWQYLKDRSGIEYYILIQLEKGLEHNSPYKIYAYNWPVPLK